jgi:putative spermidine/putrescine transport system substrate-binding protein
MKNPGRRPPAGWILPIPSESNVEPAFKKWSGTVGPNVLEYLSSSAKISEMIQTNEAAIFPLTATAIANLKAKGLPVEFAVPKEGGVSLMTGACALKGNSEPELSQKLIEYLLSAAVQTKGMELASSMPVNRNVKLSDGAQAKIGKLDVLTKNLNTVNWSLINEKRSEWNNRWNRSVEQ